MPSNSQQSSAQEARRSLSPEIALSITTSPSKLVKFARNLELDKNAAHAEIKELRRKLADITNQSDCESDDETPPAKKTRNNTQHRAHEDQAVKAGHLYVMMHGLWLQFGEATFKTEYDDEFSDSERFKTDNNKAQGQIREIMDVLATHLNKDISEPWLAKGFMDGMRMQRSNTATRLRHHCAVLFSVRDTDMLHAETRKEKFRNRIGWVGENSCGSYSSADVEVLHKNYDGSYDINTVFLNPMLMQVFCAIIRGPKSAREMITGITSNPKNDTMARKHRIRHITPGAIAATAIFTRWALSSDDLFQSVGHNTGINYARDFDEYLAFLLSGLRRKKKSTLNIIRQWDSVVFPNSESSVIDQDACSSTGFKTAMQMLDDDDVEESSEDEDNSNVENNNEGQANEDENENQS